MCFIKVPILKDIISPLWVNVKDIIQWRLWFVLATVLLSFIYYLKCFLKCFNSKYVLYICNWVYVYITAKVSVLTTWNNKINNKPLTQIVDVFRVLTGNWIRISFFKIVNKTIILKKNYFLCDVLYVYTTVLFRLTSNCK